MLRLSACAGVVSLLLLEVPLSATATDWKALARKGSGEVVTVLEVGGGDEYDETEPLFLKPADICVASDHSFYVVDYDGFIVHFSPDGEELDRFGNQGEGPGELMSPSRVAIESRGHIAVYEDGNHRISILRSDGTFIESIPYQDSVQDLAIGGDGRVVLIAIRDKWGSEPSSLYQLIRCEPDFTSPTVADSLEVRRFQPVGSAIATTPYYTEMVFCLLADGSVAYARNDRYEIRIVGQDLKPRATIRRDLKAPAITKQDREEYFRAFDASGAGFVARLREEADFPKHKPFIEMLFSDGPYLIVMREGPTLDVFEGDQFLGEVLVPEFRGPRAVDNGRLFGAKRSREKLPSVVVYSIR